MPKSPGIIRRFCIGLRNGLGYIRTMAARVFRAEAPIQGGELISDLGRFSAQAFPELDRLADPNDQRDILKMATDRAGAVGRTVLIGGLLAFLVWLPIRYALLYWIAERRLGSFILNMVISMSGGVIAVLAGVAISIKLHHRKIARQIRLELNARGLPTCIQCGYDLTGNTSGVCPECGDPIKSFPDSSNSGG